MDMEIMMKESTIYKYRFTNGGNPQDTREGEGNYRAIVLEQAVWLKSITLNGMIQVKIGRPAQLNGKGEDSFEDFTAMLEGIMSPAESDEAHDSALKGAMKDGIDFRFNIEGTKS